MSIPFERYSAAAAAGTGSVRVTTAGTPTTTV
jgi:hypothetical protein